MTWRDKDLNPAQRRAVEWEKGPCAIIAGPGSGKTRIIVARIAKLVEKGYDPTNILATTFSRKARAEMETRLTELGGGARAVTVKTLHSLSLNIMHYGRKDKIQVDQGAKYAAVLRRITGFSMMKWESCDLSELARLITAAKGNMIGPDDVEEWESPKADLFHRDRRYVEAYRRAEEQRRLEKFVTYDDMLVLAAQRLAEDRNALAVFQDRYRILMVDEFQDVNRVQYEIIMRLGGDARNILAVGDPDQCVYDFRGADSRLLTEFATSPGVEVIPVGTNYRCPQNILDVAESVIRLNRNRITGTLSSAKETAGQIHAFRCTTTDEEARGVAAEIRALVQDQQITYADILVLYRTNAQSRAIEEVFTEQEIPYIAFNSKNFYEVAEVKALLAYLRLLASKGRDAEAARLAITNPFRYIGYDDVDALIDMVGVDATIFEAIEQHQFKTAKRKTNAKKFGEDMRLLRELIVTQNALNVGDYIAWIVQRTDFLEKVRERQGSDTDTNPREQNVADLIQIGQRFTQRREFLAYIDEQAELARRRQMQSRRRHTTQNAVRCTTIHGAKGLEGKAVFIIGATEGLLPHYASLPEGIEEERRLFYVAATRAKDILFVWSPTEISTSRDTYASPSRFVQDLLEA